MKEGFTFEVKIPNEETQKALEELTVKKGKSFKSVNELFDDLEN